MGHWNYRICRKKCQSEHREHPVYFYGIYEVYYNEDGSIWATTENPTSLGVDQYVELGDTEQWALDEIKGGLDKMVIALTKPILDLDTIVFTPQPEVDDEQ
jgi:hypothetical protein